MLDGSELVSQDSKPLIVTAMFGFDPPVAQLDGGRSRERRDGLPAKIHIGRLQYPGFANTHLTQIEGSLQTSLCVGCQGGWLERINPLNHGFHLLFSKFGMRQHGNFSPHARRTFEDS